MHQPLKCRYTTDLDKDWSQHYDLRKQCQHEYMSLSITITFPLWLTLKLIQSPKGCGIISKAEGRSRPAHRRRKGWGYGATAPPDVKSTTQDFNFL